MEHPRRSFEAVLTDPRLIALGVVLALVVGSMVVFGRQLAPMLVAVLIAYLLDWPVQLLTRRRWRRGAAVAVVFSTYLIVYFGLFAGLGPLLAQRAVKFARNLPVSPGELLHRFSDAPDLSFGLLTDVQRERVLAFALEQIQQWLGALMSGSLEMAARATGWIVYLFLVPLLVFFFLKDKERLIAGVLRCLPRNLALVSRVWNEMESQLGSYVRGKVWEIVIVGVATWLAFLLLGFDYPGVLGLISGISVIIPYVGAIAAALPALVQGYLQWGASMDLVWLMVAYTVIQLVDGNVLTPMIFSEALKLHPVVILLSVLLFGGLWGFWGVLFAIPLATLVKTLLNALLEFRDSEAEGPA